jgi:cyclase
VQQAAFPAEFLPMLTFRDAMTVHFAGEEIQLTYYPDAHTDSDVVLRFPRANVIYMGGLLNYPTYAGIRSPDGFVAALDKVLAQADANTRIIPWRGPLVGKRELQEWRDLLATVRDRVAAAIRQGKTVDEIVASKPSREFDAKWGGAGAPDNFVRQIHAGLTGRLN